MFTDIVPRQIPIPRPFGHQHHGVGILHGLQNRVTEDNPQIQGKFSGPLQSDGVVGLHLNNSLDTDFLDRTQIFRMNTDLFSVF